MSYSAAKSSKELTSVVQPGWVFPGPLQGPLPGVLTKPNKPIFEGPYSNVYKGVLKINEAEFTVCIKHIRKCRVDEGQCRDASITPEERFRRRIIRESTIWGAADHPNVLRFLGYQMDDGSPLLISPWVNNGNLEAYWVRNAPPEEQKLKMLLQLQGANAGLAYLHNRNPPIVHGDLKLQNILVLDDGITTALCDFGTSRIVVEEGIQTGMTTAGAAAGTAGYQAQELISGESLPTPSSDIYAMGGVILALLSRKAPFHKKPTQAAVIIAISRGLMSEPQDHPALPASDPLWKFLRQCWECEPSKRPLVEALESALQREREPPPAYSDHEGAAVGSSA
ncbi:hypothetical protein FS837_000890 [Tulasnella sp. UAMH 9824]|nr:hypothetical protein FS837_000890 [Tulasnella sp. UAMH 9824]